MNFEKKERKDITIAFRVTPSQMAELTKKAKGYGIRPSDYIRAVVIAALADKRRYK